jgi:anti-sigma B factor antagonist
MTTPLTVEALDDGSGLRITGELDASNAKVVAERLESTDHHRGITLDLTDLDFIDSAGINVLITVARELDTEARMVIRLRPNGAVRRVVELMGIAEALDHVELENVEDGAGGGAGA